MGRHAIASCAALLAAGAILAAQPGQDSGSRRANIAVTSRDQALLRSWDASIDAMARDGELLLSRTRTDTIIAGRTHQRYEQYVHGIRVVGGEVTRQLARGVTMSIFGDLQQVTGVPDRPTLSEDDARRLFAGMATRGVPANRPVELVILPTDDRQFALAYSTHVWTDTGWMQTYLDAEDGHVILQFNDLKRQAAVGTGTGVLGDAKKVSATLEGGRYVADDALRPPTLITYDMQGNLLRTNNYLDGVYVASTSDIANDSDNTWTDGANVDAHVYLGYTYDYYFKRFGRKGLDDRDAPIYALTHPVKRSDINVLSLGRHLPLTC